MFSLNGNNINDLFESRLSPEIPISLEVITGFLFKAIVRSNHKHSLKEQEKVIEDKIVMSFLPYRSEFDIIFLTQREKKCEALDT